MHENIYQRIQENPRFHELVAKRGRFSWILAVVMLVAYYAFILMIAFDPKVLGMPIEAGSVTTWGIPAGLGLIFMSFILTGIYVQRANGEFDRMTQEILSEAQKQ